MSVVSQMADQVEVLVLVPHRNNDLAIIHKPKQLYENSRIQLSCSTLDDDRAENSHTEMGKKSNFTYLVSVSFKPEQLSAGRDCPNLQFLLGRGGSRRVECASHVPILQRTAQ